LRNNSTNIIKLLKKQPSAFQHSGRLFAFFPRSKKPAVIYYFIDILFSILKIIPSMVGFENGYFL